MFIFTVIFVFQLTIILFQFAVFPFNIDFISAYIISAYIISAYFRNEWIHKGNIILFQIQK